MNMDVDSYRLESVFIGGYDRAPAVENIMKTLCKSWPLFVFVGVILTIASSCTTPSLEVFLSPNPSFEESENQSTSLQQQQPSFTVYPQTVVSPMGVQTAPISTGTIQPASVTVSPVAVQTIAGQSGDDRLVYQLDQTLAEAEALIMAGEARLRENNPVDAIREFERARVLLEQDFEPTLQYVEQQSTIQGGGVSILSSSAIQRVRTQQTEMLARINRSYNFETMYKRQQQEDKIQTLRRESQPELQPVNLTSRTGSSRLLIQQRTRTQPIFGGSGFDMSWVPSSEVDRALDRFHQRSADFRKCLMRANRYFPQVTAILAEEGVPEELAFVALIESGYQPSVTSQSGKAGLWQLSKSVARNYGLRVTSSDDERLHIDASTRIFARYLSDLYEQFGSWEVALLGYQVGEQRLQRAIERTGTTDPQIIFQQVGQARTYFARLTAARLISTNPRAYGFDVTLPNITGQFTAQVRTQGSKNLSSGFVEPLLTPVF